MKHFLRDDDLSAEEQQQLLYFAASLKASRDPMPLLTWPAPVSGGLVTDQMDPPVDARTIATPRSVAVIFEKESTRTRISFQVGITELGGNPVIIDSQSSHLSRGETIGDTARVLSGYVDAIVIRTFGDDRIKALADAAGVPVINALTDGFHPCQALADLLTITEEFGVVAGHTIGYVGDAANNMSHSYLLAGALAGAHVRVAGPQGFQPDPRVVETASILAAESGGSVSVLDDPVAAVDGADVVATDTWVSMGNFDRDRRLATLQPFQVNSELLSKAAPHAIVLHCLPAHRGEEITDEVMDGPQSRVFQQAENRLHAQKALLSWLINGEFETLVPANGAVL